MENEVLKELTKPEIKGLKKIIFKLPSWVRYILVGIMITVFVLFSGLKAHIILFNSDVLRGVHSNFAFNFFSNNQQAVLSTQQENPKKCPADFCDFFLNFKNDASWNNKGRFNLIQENPLLLEASSSASSPGAVMTYNLEVSNFVMNLLVIPLATPSANLAVSYGPLYRCVIGDGGYKEIGCQINKSYPLKPEKWVYIDSDGNELADKSFHQYSTWNTAEDLNIKFVYTKPNNEGQILIQLNNNQSIIWKIKSNLAKKSQKENIGIGLIDPSLKHNIRAIFKSFMIDINNI